VVADGDRCDHEPIPARVDARNLRGHGALPDPVLQRVRTGEYFTSDGSRKDVDGNIRITVSVDDVMKVAGHRPAIAEVENALGQNETVSDVAVVSRQDNLKSEVPVAFALLLKGIEGSDEIVKELMGRSIGLSAQRAAPIGLSSPLMGQDAKW